LRAQGAAGQARGAARAPSSGDRPSNGVVRNHRAAGFQMPALRDYPRARTAGVSFKKVRGAIGAADPVLTDLIVTRIVELAKAGVYDIEELSSRTLSSLKSAG
jgi:hypothetical protein